MKMCLTAPPAHDRRPDSVEVGPRRETRPFDGQHQHGRHCKEDDPDDAHPGRIGALDSGCACETAGMRKLLLPAGLLLLLVATAGCGSNNRMTTEPTTAGTTTAPAPTTAITIFRVQAGRLQARAVRVPQTQAVAGAALHALGVNAAVRIASGTATVDLAQAPAEQVAEIVYTLTQFSTVQRVDVAGRSGLTRDDLAAYEPPILVEAPADGASVPLTFTVSGTASVFEATLVVELRRDGTVLSKQTVTASEGAPGRGTFSTTVHAPSSGAATIAAYAPSAADGTPQHEQDVAVTVTP